MRTGCRRSRAHGEIAEMPFKSCGARRNGSLTPVIMDDWDRKSVLVHIGVPRRVVDVVESPVGVPHPLRTLGCHASKKATVRV